MNREIGNVAGVSIMVSPEAYEEIKKRTTIYENEILSELQQRIDKAIEYIKQYENIRAYYSWVEDGYEEYNYDEDFKEDLLDILGGKDE